jgi:ABC-type multidrug transport system fused ATPase/permease subunit
MELINALKALFAGMQRRARYLLIFTLFTAISSGMAITAHAQTFAEWFAQKKTQQKYLLQQIAALQVFSGYLKQGYQIANNGLGSISGTLKTENGLHTTYYNRMKTATPVVKNNNMVKEIMAWQQDIITRLRGISEISGMTTEEKSYLEQVRSAVLKDCDQQLNTLEVVIGDGKIEMSDADRIALVTKIHTAMMENYRFASGFTAQAKLYAFRRQQEQNQVKVTKQVYGIN